MVAAGFDTAGVGVEGGRGPPVIRAGGPLGLGPLGGGRGGPLKFDGPLKLGGRNPGLKLPRPLGLKGGLPVAENSL